MPKQINSYFLTYSKDNLKLFFEKYGFLTTKLKLASLELVEDIMAWYAVAKGREVGIYPTWNECKPQVHKFSGPIYKKFDTKQEAQEFINQHSSASSFTTAQSISSLTTSKRLFSTVNNSDDKESISSKRKKLSSNTKNENGFFVDENGFTEVYTDGACTSNGRGNAKAGIGIWFADGHALNVSQPVVGRATNNMAEIQAVTVAANQAQKAGIGKLKINTDSEFLINCITKWMPKWKRSGWMTASGKPVINKQELMEMEQALAPLEISWNHVRGHIGIHGNEMADKLAREGSERFQEA